jgi:iron complex transport system substrate-binding protein
MKLISLAPSCTEILFELGIDEELVGVTTFCDFPNKAKQKPKFGGWTNPDIEAIRRELPTAVFTSTKLQEKIVKKLEKFTRVVHTDPTSLADIYGSILTIGEAVQKTNEARVLVEQMQTTIAQAALNLPKDTKKVYIEEWHTPPTVAGNWVADIVTLSGGQSFIESGKRSKKVSAKQVEKFSPEYMIVSWCGFGKKVDTKDITTRKDWDFIQNVPIIVMDDSLLNRPGPRLVEAQKQIISILHKQRDSYDEAMDILDEYYDGTDPMDPWKEIADECCSQGHPGKQKHEEGDRTPWLPKLKK